LSGFFEPGEAAETVFAGQQCTLQQSVVGKAEEIVPGYYQVI